ncbi:MAG: RNA polymerase sigma factor [Planctomycetales bacterium]|nr:RNA polymerase sigma factor [Planctomycetales bacterium]
MLKPTPRVNRSDGQALSELTLWNLFETEETPLLRYAFTLTGRRAVAEEIVQDVFLQLHSHWDNVQNPQAWLIRSVRNRAFSYLRDNKREVLAGDDNSRDLSSGEETPEELLLRMEASRVLRQSLHELDPSDRELVKLKYFEGLKYSEISHQTGLSIGNVGYRLHHILKQLAEKLRPLGIDEKS